MLTCIGGRQGGIAVRPPRGREAAVPNLENESFTSEQKPPFYCTNSQRVQLTSVLVFLLGFLRLHTLLFFMTSGKCNSRYRNPILSTGNFLELLKDLIADCL